MEGSVQRSGNRVRITAELVDGSNDHHLWARSYERDAGDALGLQNEVAQAIASEIQVKLTPQEQARLTPPRPVNTEAQEAYLRGTYWSDKGDLVKSFDYFQGLLRKTPTTRPPGRRSRPRTGSGSTSARCPTKRPTQNGARWLPRQ